MGGKKKITYIRKDQIRTTNKFCQDECIIQFLKYVNKTLILRKYKTNLMVKCERKKG